MSTSTVTPEITQIAREMAPALIENYGRFVSRTEILREISKRDLGLNEDDTFAVEHQIKCYARNAAVRIEL